jgi:hypothetical protein
MLVSRLKRNVVVESLRPYCISDSVGQVLLIGFMARALCREGPRIQMGPHSLRLAKKEGASSRRDVASMNHPPA